MSARFVIEVDLDSVTVAWSDGSQTASSVAENAGLAAYRALWGEPAFKGYTSDGSNKVLRWTRATNLNAPPPITVWVLALDPPGVHLCATEDAASRDAKKFRESGVRVTVSKRELEY